MRPYSILTISKNGKQLDRCLTSLLVSQPKLQLTDIYVVDDGLDEANKKKWAVNYIKGNGSFTHKLNLGLASIPKDKDLFFLSDGSIILTKKCIEILSSVVYQDPEIGMIAPVIEGLVDNSYQVLGKLYKPTKRSELKCREGFNPTLNFIAVFIKNEVLHKIGPIPENLISSSYEDSYFCSRMADAGYEWMIYPDAAIFHEWEGFNASATYDRFNYRIAEFDLNPHEKELIEHVKKSIENSERGISKLTKEILDLEGMSSKKFRFFLNNLCSTPKINYLEIGCWKGSTFISALFGNKENLQRGVAVDNWSKYGGPREEFYWNSKKFLTDYPIIIISDDCFNINLSKFSPSSVNVYFYDGEHSAQSQEKAFTYFNPIFDELFIAIIDDWNWEYVREGTQKAFDQLNYSPIFEVALPSRWNGDKEHWWNGSYVAIMRKKK